MLKMYHKPYGGLLLRGGEWRGREGKGRGGRGPTTLSSYATEGRD